MGRTLGTLLAQRPRPDAVRLTLPRRFRRFPGWDGTPPALPRGVSLHWTDDDLGPATKVLPAAAALAGTGTRLVWCDDDWLYGQGWLAALTAASKARPDAAIAGSGYAARRLGLPLPAPPAGETQIAQGFSGVLVPPDALPPEAWRIPPAARWVDDVWLSGMLALARVPILLSPAARALCTPHDGEAAPLQQHAPGGQSRGAANKAAAAYLHRVHKVWN